MKLTTFTDYSLRVLIHVATAPEGRATIAQVAQAFDISENHLVKVVHLLGREGFLFNTRGRGGGLRLARPASQIRVGAVVRAAEGGDAIAECFDAATNRCVIAPVCRLGGALARAMAAFHAVLDDYTLEDIVANRKEVVAILHRHPRAPGLH
ncbi:MAG TPA: Rrf2 family transcriptional regulator [Myxococcota bacterium]|nr:Rrf2 family transcriptional regulator [Myxococcota bacterium]